VSEAIQASLSLDEVVKTVGDTALGELEGDLVCMWLDDGEGGYFERLRLAGTTALHTGVDLGRIDPQGLADHFRFEPLVLEQGKRGLRFFAQPPEVPLQSLVAVPLRVKTRLLGWIVVGSLTSTKRFNEGHRKLLAIVASRAAAALENARLYEDLQATFAQTIQGLARAIDKMDRYTAGHSERVALYALFLAGRMKMDLAQLEIVRQSALMHDIGKIGCVMNLNKPGKLTAFEYEEFKRHAVYGRDILEPIKFLHPLIPGVHMHHERWDGRGYPLGLKGADIPVMARIISVADTYDAMTSDRAYRRSLPHEVSINEIERCSGSQFDPEVAAAFTEGIDEWRAEREAKGERNPD
jgi:response regulator RpfG family c-di-GMP phosphodiesterase